MRTVYWAVIFVAGSLILGCGSNPEDKEVKPIDRTRSFKKLVSGTYQSKSGDSFQFTRGEKGETLLTIDADTIYQAEVTTNGHSQFTLKLKDSRGSDRTIYVRFSSAPQGIPAETTAKLTFECSYVHTAKVDKLMWLPRPRNSEKIDYEIKNMREKSQDVNFVLELEELNTEESSQSLIDVDHAEMKTAFNTISSDLDQQLSDFCEAPENLYDKEDGWQNASLPLKNYDKNTLELIQFNDYYSLKFGSFKAEQVTDVTFTKVEE